MAIGPIGPLPPMPNPGDGVVQQPMQAGLAQGVMAFLQARRQKQQDDLAKQQAEAKIKQQQIQNAQASLPMLIQMAKAQPGNAQVQAKLKETLQLLNMPLPMQQDGGPDLFGQAQPIPGGTPQTTAQPQAQTQDATPQGQTGGFAGGNPNPLQQHGGIAGLLQRIRGQQQPQTQGQVQPQAQPQGQIDVDALSPAPYPNEKQIEYLMGLPSGSVREGAVRTMHVSVDPDFLKAPPLFVPGSAGYNNAYRILQQINTQAAQGLLTADQYANALKQNSSMFQSAQIDTSTTDPTVIVGLSRKAQADIDKNIALGAHYKNEDLVALQNAHSLEELRAAQAKLAAAHAKALPMEEAAKIKHMQAQDAAAASRAASYASRVTQLNKDAQNGNKAAIAQIMGLTRLADTDFRATEGALQRAISMRDHLINDEGVNPQDPQMAEMNKTIAGLQEQLTNAKQTRDDMLKKYAGATGLTSQLHLSGLPGGSDVKPVVDITKATRTATDAHGTKYYDIPGRGFVDANGNPYKP